MKKYLLTFVALVCSLMVSAYGFEQDLIYYNITSETDLTVEVTSSRSFSENQIYSWQGAAGGATEKGGVATGHGICEGRVNSLNAGYYALSVSSKKANIDTDYILITLDQPLEANDKLEITAYRNKDTDTNGTLYILFENGQAIDEGGEVIWNNVAFGLEPNTNSYNVGEGAGSKTIKLSRSAASTNVNITKFVITRSTSNITFADSKVKEICVANWDTNGDGELSLSEAAAVTTIGQTFHDEEITSFDELQYFTSVETLKNSAFTGCSSLTSITLPAGVTSIGGFAFNDCSSLTSITLPAGLTSIEKSTFDGCSSLTSITLPAGVTSIGVSAFYRCSSLTSVTLPAGLTSIGDWAFYRCSSLTSLTLPAGLTSIGVNAFEGCSSLTSVTLPAGLTSIGGAAFNKCDKLTTVIVGDATPAALVSGGVFSNRSNAVLYVPAGSKAAYESASVWSEFKEIVEFENITFADSKVKEICVANWDTNGDGELSYIEAAAVVSVGKAFSGSTITSFDELQYFTALEKVSGEAFSNCVSLTSIILPSNVKKIEQNAFYSSGIISIEIPASVSSIAEAAFNEVFNMESITVAEGNPVYDSRNGCNAIIETATNTLVAGCKNTVIPNSVTAIGSSAFRGSTNLTSIGIPSSVTSIAADAFKNCDNLTSVIVGNATPVAVEGDVLFSRCYNATLYVPAGSKAAYESVSVWSKFAEIVEIENITFADSKVKEICVANWDANGDGELSLSEAAAVTTIGQTFKGNAEITSFDELQYFTSVETLKNSAFNGCSSLTSITLPAGVTSIGMGAFAACSSLTSITLPAGLTSIEEYTFFSCSSLTSITLPEGVTSIGERAFAGCSSLTRLTLPAGLTSIGEYTFSYCSSLTSITLPAGVTSIEGMAFSYCSSLTSLTLPAGLTSIEYDAFCYCSSLTSLTLPAGVTSIGDAAFGGCDKLTTVIVGDATPAALVSGGVFSNRSNAVLYVPAGSKSAYESASVWSEFKEIVEIENITFADSKVKEICVANWDTNGDGELGYIEAAAVTTIGKAFKGKEITSFDELQYFTALEKVSGNAFYDCVSLTSIILPSNVKTIEQNAFYSSGIISLEIPASVSSIAEAAFNGIINMESITVAEGNPVYDSRNGCNAIIETATNTLVAGCKNTVIPNGVTAIGSSAFRSNTNLTSINIPGSVTTIATDAFKGCKALTTVTVGSTTPLQLVDVNTFPSRRNATLYVPAGSKSAYESAFVWSEFWEIVEEMEVPENMFVLNNMTLRAGQSGLFPVALTNESEFTAFQCDIYLPEGITLQTNKGKYDITLDEERMDDQTITTALQADGAIRMAVASLTSSLFWGNSGNLFYLNLLGGENISGDLAISIKNIHISTVDGTMYDLEDVTATITVPAYTPADVNNDGVIAINDVVLTINAVLGTYADNLVFAAADMNGDNQIMINDVVQVINSVLGLNTTSVLTARHIVRETLDITETQGGFSMSLSNAAGYTAMQYDMTLPAGVSINDIRVTSGSNHSVSFREVGDGQVRVAVVSLTNEAFASGSLLEVSVSAESATSISITNAYAATRGGVMVEVSDAEAQLTRGGATGIQAVGVETAPADIFDLSGRMVKKAGTSLEGLDKGVYLMNGKKVLVK